MDTEAAQIVLGVIVAIGAVFWLTGLQFLTGSTRAVKSSQPDESDPPFTESRNRLAGTAEVDGQPSVLAIKAASLLARNSPFGPVKIVEKADDRIKFERLGPGIANQPAARWFRQGDLRFVTAGRGRCRIEWAVELAKMGWLLLWGLLFQVFGLVALVVGGWAIYTYVVSSPDPAVRWQTLQMLQVGHFLWPPFLFGSLYRRGRREVAAQFEALANNLPFCGD